MKFQLVIKINLLICSVYYCKCVTYNVSICQFHSSPSLNESCNLTTTRHMGIIPPSGRRRSTMQPRVSIRGDNASMINEGTVNDYSDSESEKSGKQLGLHTNKRMFYQCLSRVDEVAEFLSLIS